MKLLSRVRLPATPWTAAYQAPPSMGFSRQEYWSRVPLPSPSWSLLKLITIESVMPSNNLIICHPILLLPSINPSIMVFSNEPALHIRWPKYWSFSFNISPSNEHSGLISFRMDRLDLPESPPRDSQESSPTPPKASILRHSAFYNSTLTSINDY